MSAGRHPKLLILPVKSIGALLSLYVLSSFASAQQSRIIRPIDNTQRTTLTGHIHPKATPANDQGPVAGDLKLYVTLEFAQSASQKADLTQLLADQQNPNSPNYHQWLTPEQYADRFGLSPDDITKVTSWLQSQGLTVASVARGRNSVAVNGTAAQIETAFQTEIHKYQVNGEQHFANATEPSVPAALGTVVMSIRGLHDFRLRPRAVKPRYNSENLCGGNCLAPGDVATIYNINPLYSKATPIDGTGQTIAVAGQTDIYTSDITTFRSNYGLPPINLQQILVPGSPDPGVSNQGDLPEADLDLEWSGAVAKNAKILYVYADPNYMFGVLSAVQYAIDNNLAPVVSTSYGSCELEDTPSDMLAYQSWAEQGNAEGVTWFNAAGDSGGADCDDRQHPGLAVDTPASVPQIVAVGGTEFAEGSGTFWSATSNPTTGASALSYIPETTWNDSIADGSPSAGGGGVSVQFAQPSWQAGPGTFLSGGRNVPDVSLTASADHDGYLVFTSDPGSCEPLPTPCTTVYGGTSVSAQVFTGIGALMNQYAVSSGKQSKPGLGNLNAVLYSLAKTTPAIFHDITTGNNIVTVTPCGRTANCVPVGYNAGPGYDPATGLGSVDVCYLVTGTACAAIAVPVTVSTLSLPGGATGALYSYTLSASGGSGGPYTWAIVSGALPAGLALTPATGVIGGTPTAAGSNFTFSVTATDSTGKVSSPQSLSIAISTPGPAITSVSPSSTSAGSPSVTVTITGSGFTSASVAQFNGLALTTTFVSSTTLTATIPAGDLLNQGSGQITVTNAGVASNILPFVISSSSSLQFLTVAPCRIMDTRNANGPLGGPYVSGATTRTVPIPSSPCGIPANASAYSLNFTVVPRDGVLSYLTVWPTGQPQPLVSTLNSLDGEIIANAAIVPAGSAGAINAYATNDTDLIVDINGYFVPPTTSTLQFYPLTALPRSRYAKSNRHFWRSFHRRGNQPFVSDFLKFRAACPPPLPRMRSM